MKNVYDYSRKELGVDSVVGLKMIVMTWKTTGMDSVILDSSAPNGYGMPNRETRGCSQHGSFDAYGRHYHTL